MMDYNNDDNESIFFYFIFFIYIFNFFLFLFLKKSGSSIVHLFCFSIL